MIVYERTRAHTHTGTPIHPLKVTSASLRIFTATHHLHVMRVFTHPSFKRLPSGVTFLINRNATRQYHERRA